MSMCVCGADRPCNDLCEKHDRVRHGYPCGDCDREWQEANPKTAAAGAKFAAGKGTLAAIERAKTEDMLDQLRALHEPDSRGWCGQCSTSPCETGRILSGGNR
jgi:hypothetical protein